MHLFIVALSIWLTLMTDVFASAVRQHAWRFRFRRESVPTQLVINAQPFAIPNDAVCQHFVLTGKDGNINFIATCNWCARTFSMCRRRGNSER